MSMIDNPKVSVVMPVLNGEKYIVEAIDSVLNQIHGNVELIVINDGSTDRTESILASYGNRIRCIRHERNMGIVRSMNDGVEAASGEFIAFLDSDDVWLPEFLQLQLEHLQKNTDVGMVHSDFMTIDENGTVLEHSVAKCRNRGVRPSGDIYPALFMDSMICGDAVLIRRECFEKLGSFDENLRFGDYDMWLRIAKSYRIDYQDAVLTKYRQHSTQSHRNTERTVAVNVPPSPDSCAVATLQKQLHLFPNVVREIGKGKIKRRLAQLNYEAALFWYERGIFQHARTCIVRSLRFRPSQLHRYLPVLMLTMLKPRNAWAIHSAVSSWRKKNEAQRTAEKWQRIGGSRPVSG